MVSATSLWAQVTPEELTDQREADRERQRELREDFEELRKEPQTAQEVADMLREKALLRIKGRRKELLKKRRFSTGVTFGTESNPATNSAEKGDQWIEDTFSAHWTPIWSKKFSGDFGYNLTDRNYFEQTALGSVDHTFNLSLTLSSLMEGRLTLDSGIYFDIFVYPYDSSASYKQYKPFIKFTNYITNKWTLGGKYEHWDKDYLKKVARNGAGTNLNIARSDVRNVLELWVKRKFGKYSLKLKAKSYRNDSNDRHQDFYDHDSHHGYFTVSRPLLKGNKLFASYTFDYEGKEYKNRLSDSADVRKEKIQQHSVNLNYTLKKWLSIIFSFTHKESHSNAASGVYDNTTVQLGLTANF